MMELNQPGIKTQLFEVGFQTHIITTATRSNLVRSSQNWLPID
jgi:hypothetical protein